MDAIEDCIKDVAAFEVMLGSFIVHNDLTSKLDLEKAFQLSCELIAISDVFTNHLQKFKKCYNCTLLTFNTANDLRLRMEKVRVLKQCASAKLSLMCPLCPPDEIDAQSVAECVSEQLNQKGEQKYKSGCPDKQLMAKSKTVTVKCKLYKAIDWKNQYTFQTITRKGKILKYCKIVHVKIYLC